MKTIVAADLFCGAGGTSTGMAEAVRAAGLRLELTAVNHWDVAVATHTANHPEQRHFCASLDALNPHHLFPAGKLDLLWASPECTHHSRARGGRPRQDQSRATAWCVVRWAEALRPKVVLIENVPEFLEWGPLTKLGKPDKRKRGALFRAWVSSMQAAGYRVEHRLLCAADYGDPTSRTRLFVQASRGEIRWPEPTHGKSAQVRWRAAREVIDWSVQGTSIFSRRRPLAANTMKRIMKGVRKYGGAPFVVAWDHQSSAGIWSQDEPLSTVTTKARHGVVQPVVEPFVLGQQSKSAPRSVDEPLPTIATTGGISLIDAFLVPYYGTSGAASVDAPLPTVTCLPRFGLAQPSVTVDGEKYLLDIRFRMLQPGELAQAQGFPADYVFTGNKKAVCRQIGNAVPCGLSRALVSAVIPTLRRA